MRQLLLGVATAGLLGAGLYPLAHRVVERSHQMARIDRLRFPGATRVATADLAARVEQLEPILASWQDVGGCGVGGGPGGVRGDVRWIGRHVTGGLVNFEAITSAAFVDGGQTLTVNLRPSTELFEQWILSANVPFLVKLQEVDVEGTTGSATLSGFGDPSLDVTYEFGITYASRVTLSLAVPPCPDSNSRTDSCVAGAYDAVRHGVVLPQQAQLGTGQFAASITIEHTVDEIWGMLLLGGMIATPLAGRTGPGVDFATHPGEARIGANSIGDYRAASASAYAYVGYLWGPFVPHAGLTLRARYEKDRERWELLEEQSLLTGTLHLGIEWASDYVAFLLAANTVLSADHGLGSWTLALGASTSLL